jgi:hypothetical protein
MTDLSTRSDPGTEKLNLPHRLQQPRFQSKDAADYLQLVHNVQVSMRTLDKWRVVGRGPKFEKLLGRAYYKPEWLDEWVAEKSSGPVNSTSALSA